MVLDRLLYDEDTKLARSGMGMYLKGNGGVTHWKYLNTKYEIIKESRKKVIKLYHNKMKAYKWFN